MASTPAERKFQDSVFEFLRNDQLLDHCIDWIRNNLSPEDVFRSSDLESWAKDWAEDNGYKQTEL